MRPTAALIVVLLPLLAAACSGGTGGVESTDSPSTAPPGETLEALWHAPGEDVAVVPGTSDYAPGPNRVSFLIVREGDELVERSTAKVYLARALEAVPFATTTATLEPIGVPGGETADAGNIYVATLTLPGPGKYWYLAEPVGGTPIQALGNLVVGKTSASPAIGDPAIAIDSPTLRSTGGDLEALTTARDPDRPLYERSVAEALRAKEPFVVSFATPEFCQTRTCGPVVDVVSAVRKRLAGSGVRFIHIEIYTKNDPALGVNEWVDAWKLPTEPFTFVVDRKGIVRSKLEGAFSAAELEAAARSVS
jgi:hypothetical protein